MPWPGQSTTLRWVPGPQGSSRASVEASGLADPALLRVYAGAQRETPMAGTYRTQGGRVLFEPRFPLLPETDYTATVGERTATYRLPPLAPAPPTRLVAVFPTAEKLPLNLLKFYLHFSAPMSRGDAYSHLRLVSASGAPVELPFLELPQELWNPELTRLTLLFDPGRIKRGVKPREELGGALELGKHYTLEIDARWQDGNGRPLAAPFRKRFSVLPADRTPIEPARWRLHPPRAGTREPLVVRFNEPLDHALALRLLQVLGVEGEAALTEHETLWRFTPTLPWQRRRYTLSAPALLEDLAGNNIGKAFDVERARHPAPFRANPTPIWFTPRSRG